jgi:hypothetical protein
MTPPPTTAVAFRLPFGLVDVDGRLHRDGVLRLPTQADLTAVLKVAGEVDNPAYLETLLLARMLVRLGTLRLTDDGKREAVARLVQPDVEHLNAVYEGLARGGEACPHCGRPS